jgi:N-acetylglucosamine-6-sulfatase
MTTRRWWTTASSHTRPAITTVGLTTLACLILVSSAQSPGVHSLAAGPGVQAQVSARAAVERPNIVLFLTDDMRADDLKYLPQTCALLGGSGVTFGRSFSPNPLCCPARAELVTGQYTHNNGTHSNSGAWGGMASLKDPDNNIGVWLQDAGYRTALVGKYLNGYNGWYLDQPTPAGWDRFDATIRWIYEYTRYQFESYGRPHVLDSTNTGLDARGRPYITRAETEIMDGYIDDFSADGQPYFLFDSLLAPHSAWGDVGDDRAFALPEPRYEHLYAGKAVNPATRSAAFLDQHVRDVPVEARATTPADGVRLETAMAQQRFLHRIRALASVDDHVAEVISKVKEAGQLDKTVFIFTSDNGFMLGEHNHKTKFLGYHESLRVPLIVSGPGFPRGVTSAYPVTTVDVSATILDLAGATAGRLGDGQSVISKIGDSTPRAFPIEGDTIKSPGTREWGWQGAHWGRYSYMRYWNGGEELYDLTRSSWQEQNLVHNARYRAILDQMRTLYRELRSCRGTVECNPPAQVPPAPKPQDRPRFDLTWNRRVVDRAGGQAFQIRVRVARRSAPVDTGTVRLMVDESAVGPRAVVTNRGYATVRWNPLHSTARGTHHLSIRYDGADQDVTAGQQAASSRVRIR